MNEIIGGISEQTRPESVWLLEHPPLYTAGSSARDSDIFNPHNYPTYKAGRGGQWTNHGPGQRVAYVMLDLKRAHGLVAPRDLHSYIHTLEEWLIRTLQKFDVSAERHAGRVGVWVSDKRGREAKIAAIGVKVTRWVSWHGVALNVSPDLEAFKGIIPCGLPQYGVTSLCELGIRATLEEVDEALRATWQECFGGPSPSMLPG